MSHLLQINDDASRVLGGATIRNFASYGEHSGSQVLPLDQASQQSSSCSLHRPFIPTTGNLSIQTLRKEISYANTKQFDRILKLRETRNQLDTKLGRSSGNRRKDIHESRHQWARRRPRAKSGRFLSVTDVAQLRTGSERREAKEKATNVSFSIERKRSEFKGVTYSNCRDKGSCKPLREKQFHMGMEKPNKGSTKINKALIMSFYGAEELGELHQRYAT